MKNFGWAVLITAVVVGLYSSIPHTDGLETLNKILEEQSDKSVSMETPLEPPQIVLKNNYF